MSVEQSELELKRGITVNIVGDRVCNRVKVSSGTYRHKDDLFSSNSFLAKNDWREVTDSESDILEEKSELKVASTAHISVFKTPPLIDEYFGIVRQGIKKHNKEKVALNLFRHPDYIRGKSELLSQCRRSMPDRKFKSIQQYSREMGALSSSLNLDNKYIGLHIDNWGSPYVSERKSGFPTRLCVNLGPEERFLQFINLTVFEIQNLLDSPLNDADELAKAFMAKFPSYPVFELSILPGEAYIAPTEIMVHDANTVNKTFIDASHAIVGEFDSHSYRYFK